MQAEESFQDASERLYEAFHFILHSSIEEIDREELVNELIEVMLEDLDENSRFMDPERSEERLESLGISEDSSEQITYTTFTVLEDYLYIRIDVFGAGANKQLRNGFDALDEMPKGIVLDLRDNPGGWMHEAVAVVDAFIDQGLIVEQRGRRNIVRDKQNATQPMLIPINIPIVILIDNGSASASEIVAGALKDHNRAILMGETTYGKATVQVWRELENGSTVWVTTKKYYTKGGSEIHGYGIEPNVIYIRQGGYSYGFNDPNDDPQIKKAIEMMLDVGR